jgi:hypothetical protein
MTIQRDLNRGGLGGNFTTWYLWQQFLAAGYSIDASGSGTGGVYSAVGDVFDPVGNPVIGAAVVIGVGIGSESWGAQRCWALFTALDGSQLVIQRGNTAGNAGDDEWCYSYSPDGVFNLGAANANTAPVAADQRDLWGTLNAVWPSIHQVGNVANMIHVAVDDALSVQGFSGFLCVELVNPNALKAVVMVDDLTQVPSGGLFSAHAKAFHVATGVGQLLANIIGNPASAPYALVDKGGGTESWDRVPYNVVIDSVGGSQLYPGGGLAPSSGEVPAPIFVGDPTHGGFGGLSRWLSWPAMIRVYNDRSNAEDRWYIEDAQLIGLPDGATIPSTI